MKLALASDLHLEFGDIDFGNPDAAEVLILSGDILVASDFDHPDRQHLAQRYHAFMQRCSQRFAHVIYVLGNHEHYNGDFATTAHRLRSQFASLTNLHLLDRSTVTIDDITFIGGTLWTDMNNHDPMTIFHMKRMVNDFRFVTNSGVSAQAKFLPEDAVEEHDALIKFIETTVANHPHSKFVVVGHHAPSQQSIMPKYAHDHLTNGGFVSNLNNFILEHPSIKLWTHGHTHDGFDYTIGATRVVCNPRGYIGFEESANNWQLISLDV